MKTFLITALAFSLIGEFSRAAEPTVKLRPRNPMQRRNYSFKPTVPAKKTVATKNIKAAKPKTNPAPAPLILGAEDANIQTAKITFFAKDGNVPLQNLSSIVISNRVVAARLEKRDDFQNLARRMRVLISGTKYVSLKLSELDLNSGWMIFQADENLPLEAPETFPKNLPASLATMFGYTDPWELAKDWSKVIEKTRGERQIASRLTPGMIIERELSDFEQRNMAKFIKSGRKIEMERFALSPMADDFQCSPANVNIKNQANQLVSGASALSCKSLGTEGILGIRVESGVVDFWANGEYSNATQTKLLENLASNAFRDHKNESEKADNSTHSVCQKSQLTDNSIEVHYCTRTLRAAPSFQDTVAIFGRRSRAKFLYTILRTGAMSELSTKKAIESVMNVLEENP